MFDELAKWRTESVKADTAEEVGKAQVNDIKTRQTIKVCKDVKSAYEGIGKDMPPETEDKLCKALNKCVDNTLNLW